LDGGRVEQVWDAEQDEGADEVILLRWISHSVELDPAMDDAFPWRDAAAPSERVYELFADAQGRVHAVVRANAHQVTAKFSRNKARVLAIAEDPADRRLPVRLVRNQRSIFEKLEHNVAAEIRRLILGRPAASRRVRADQLADNHFRPFENLAGQKGLFLTAAAYAENLLLSNGEFLGVYVGAVLDSEEALRLWEAKYRLYPRYGQEIHLSGKKRVMSAEGAASSVAFANTALTPDGEPDHSRINALFIEFRIRLPTKYGRLEWMPIQVLVALDNAFNRRTNRYALVLADYGDDYVRRNLQVPIKQEEAKDGPAAGAHSVGPTPRRPGGRVSGRLRLESAPGVPSFHTDPAAPLSSFAVNDVPPVPAAVMHAMGEAGGVDPTGALRLWAVMLRHNRPLTVDEISDPGDVGRYGMTDPHVIDIQIQVLVGQWMLVTAGPGDREGREGREAGDGRHDRSGPARRPSRYGRDSTPAGKVTKITKVTKTSKGTKIVKVTKEVAARSTDGPTPSRYRAVIPARWARPDRDRVVAWLRDAAETPAAPAVDPESGFRPANRHQPSSPIDPTGTDRVMLDVSATDGAATAVPTIQAGASTSLQWAPAHLVGSAQAALARVATTVPDPVVTGEFEIDPNPVVLWGEEEQDPRLADPREPTQRGRHDRLNPWSVGPDVGTRDHTPSPAQFVRMATLNVFPVQVHASGDSYLEALFAARPAFVTRWLGYDDDDALAFEDPRLVITELRAGLVTAFRVDRAAHPDSYELGTRDPRLRAARIVALEAYLGGSERWTEAGTAWPRGIRNAADIGDALLRLIPRLLKLGVELVNPDGSLRSLYRGEPGQVPVRLLRVTRPTVHYLATRPAESRLLDVPLGQTLEFADLIEQHPLWRTDTTPLRNLWLSLQGSPAQERLRERLHTHVEATHQWNQALHDTPYAHDHSHLATNELARAAAAVAAHAGWHAHHTVTWHIENVTTATIPTGAGSVETDPRPRDPTENPRAYASALELPAHLSHTHAPPSIEPAVLAAPPVTSTAHPRRVMITFPRPTLTIPSTAPPDVEDGWRQDPPGDAVAGGGTVSSKGRIDIAGHRFPVGKNRGGQPSAGPVSYWYTESKSWLEWPDGRRAMVTFSRPTLSMASTGGQKVEDDWSPSPPPGATAGTGRIAGGKLSVGGQTAKVGTNRGGKPSAGPVSYWHTESTIWIEWPDGRHATVAFSSPVLIRPTPSTPVADGWPHDPPANAVADEGRISKGGVFSHQSHLIQVGRKRNRTSTAGPVSYHYTESMVWIAWPDGRRAFVEFAEPTFTMPAALAWTVVDGWRQEPPTDATIGTGRIAAGNLSVAGRMVPVGSTRGGLPTVGKVSHWHTESTIWIEWTDGRRATVTFPGQTLTTSVPEVSDGWLDGPPPDAAKGKGRVSASGGLLVQRNRIGLGGTRGGDTTFGPVSFQFTESMVWIEWPDGRQATARFPGPILAVPAVAAPEVVDGWPQEPPPGASAGRGRIHAGQLNVARYVVGLGRRPNGTPTDGTVTYWFTESELWIEWVDPDQNAAGDVDVSMTDADAPADHEPGWARVRPMWELPEAVRHAAAPTTMTPIRPGLDTVPTVGGRQLHQWFRLADASLVARFRADIGPDIVAQTYGDASQRFVAGQRFAAWLSRQSQLPVPAIVVGEPGRGRDAVLHPGRERPTMIVDVELLNGPPDPTRLLAVVLHEMHHAEHDKLLALTADHATDSQLAAEFPSAGNAAGIRAAARLLAPLPGGLRPAPTTTVRSGLPDPDDGIATQAEMWHRHWNQPAEQSASAVERLWIDLDAFSTAPLPATAPEAIQDWLAHSPDWYRSELRLQLNHPALTTGQAEVLLRRQPHRALLTLARHGQQHLGYQYLTERHRLRRQQLLYEHLHTEPHPETLIALAAIVAATAQTPTERLWVTILTTFADQPLPAHTRFRLITLIRTVTTTHPVLNALAQSLAHCNL